MVAYLPPPINEVCGTNLVKAALRTGKSHWKKKLIRSTGLIAILKDYQIGTCCATPEWAKALMEAALGSV